LQDQEKDIVRWMGWQQVVVCAMLDRAVLQKERLLNHAKDDLLEVRVDLDSMTAAHLQGLALLVACGA
jgi:hypothetical protein